MANSILLSILKLLMVLIFAGWVSLWLLKPTNLWTRKWKGVEDSARPTIFGYYGGYSKSSSACILLATISPISSM